MQTSFIKFLAAALALSVSVTAHPDTDEEIAALRHAHIMGRRSLEGCSEKLQRRELVESRLAKRAALIERAFGPTVATTLTKRADPAEIYRRQATCILAPQEEIGPYYISGEKVREDVRETQTGVTLALDIQVIDQSTCEPIEGAEVDIWEANATGSYSAAVCLRYTDSKPNTYLRGLQSTDSDGVAGFITIFPGHYNGRATHIHTVIHVGGSETSAGTYTGGTIPHIGQLFFNQDMITAVEKLAPYTSNTAAITLNSADRVYTQQVTTINQGYDDIVDVELVGSTISQGLVGTIYIAINTAAQYHT
ncbi:Intradiol ring-cleavage dioxygenase [Geopyxis carbonaria]|nr:Intradiol ring-cleavage dioxygenase [Geopyxis carbonaria]